MLWWTTLWLVGGNYILIWAECFVSLKNKVKLGFIKILINTTTNAIIEFWVAIVPLNFPALLGNLKIWY